MGSPKAQSHLLNRMELHQSFVGTGPLGAFAVTNARGLVDRSPQPAGSAAPDGSAVV